jgi:hypothetical protein
MWAGSGRDEIEIEGGSEDDVDEAHGLTRVNLVSD